MHNLPALVKGKDTCTIQVHPDDAARLGLVEGGHARVTSASGELVVPVEVTDEIMPGVVSIPHGWGHDVAGNRMAVAAEHAGVNSNLIAPTDVDVPSGNAVLNGIPVDIDAATTSSASIATQSRFTRLRPAFPQQGATRRQRRRSRAAVGVM